MDSNLQRILLNAQKSGVLQLSMQLQQLPSEIYQLNTLKLSDKGFYENQNLKRMLLKGCQIQNISEEINMLDTLEVLELPQNQLSNFVTLTMQFLTRLNLQGNKLYQGIDISQLPSLKQLYLNENQLQGTIQMQSQTLQIFHINKNHINTLILDMPELIDLIANNNEIQRIGLHNCQKLQQLELQFNQLKQFDFTQLSSLTTLNLQRNGLNIDQQVQFQFPRLQSLEILNLSENNIQQLDISCFINQKIKELIVANAHIDYVVLNIDQKSEMFKECISAMKKSTLTYIDLQGNNLQFIAPELCFLNQLRKIALTGNPMRKMSKLLQIQDKIESVRQYLQDKLPLDHPGLKQEAQNVINTKTNVNYYVNTNKIILDNIMDFQEDIFSNQNAHNNFQTINIQNIDLPQESLETIFLRYLSKFQNLQQLTLQRVKYLDNLQIFNLQSLVQITCSQLPSLEYVVINNCLNLQSIQITECRLLDIFVNNCRNIRTLNLSHNSLDKFPDCIFEMSNLIELQLGNNNIESINDNIEQVKSLQKLCLENNNIKTLKASLGRCTFLQQLKLDGNNIVRPSRQVLSKPTQQLLQFLRGE